MKKTTIFFLIGILSVSGLWSQTPTLDKFNESLSSALSGMNAAIPDAAVVGGTWSDSYIGQLIAVPPHFGIGVAAGASRFPVSDLNDAIAMTGLDLPTDTLILPNFAIEGRIGGFMLPFDIGFRFGMLPDVSLKDLSINYLNFGVDVRYALLKEGLVKPDLIVGIGYYRAAGEISYSFGTGDLALVDIPAPYASQEQDLTLSFASNVFEGKVQVSKSLFIITPYAGLGGSVAISDSSYEVANQDGSEKETIYGARVYGGFSLNVAVLKFDVSGMYNFISGNWGFNLGPRIQF